MKQSQDVSKISSTVHWHAKENADVLESLSCTQEGLSSEQVTERLAKYGPNLLPEAKTRGPLKRFLAQCNNSACMPREDLSPSFNGVFKVWD